MPQRHRDAYPPEFKTKLVAFVLAGRSPEELADEFEPSGQTICNWVRQAQLDAGDRKDGLTTDERQEIARLRKRVKQLEIEREILSKATAWFARESMDRSDLRIHEGVPGHVSGPHDEPRTEGFGKRFYAWMKRSPSEHAQSDVLLGDRTEAISRCSRSTYGRPRIHAELVDEGIRISGKRVAWLMRNRSVCVLCAARRQLRQSAIVTQSRHLISSSVASQPMLPINYGSPISRTFPCGAVSCTSP